MTAALQIPEPSMTELHERALRRVRRFMRGQAGAVSGLGDAEGFGSSDRVQFPEARDGGFGVVRDGVTLDSTYAPLAHARRVVEREDLSGAEMVIILGCGSCAVPLAVYEATESAATKVVVLEPDPDVVYGALARAEGLDDCDRDRLSFFTTMQSLKLHVGNTYKDKRRILLMATPAYRRVWSEVFAKLPEVLEEATFLAAITANTGESRSRQWVHNLLENLHRWTEHPSVFAMENLFEGVPAVVVAAGPSLDKNVQLLHEIRDRVLILCVNTSLKAVLEAGIRPHLVLSLESLNVSTHFDGVDLSEHTVVLDQTCHPSLFELDAPRFFTFLDTSPAHVAFAARTMKDDRVRGLSVGGSIANASFSVAYTLGCNPIMLIGQDLAYTGGQMYAKGTVFEGITLDVDGQHGRIVDPTGVKQAIIDASGDGEEKGTFYADRAMIPVPSWDGEGTVMTSMDFNLFRYWFQEAAIHVQEHREVTLVNATEGGARIEGFDHIPLRDAIDRYVGALDGGNLDRRIEAAWADAPRYERDVYEEGMRQAVLDCEELLSRCAKARKAERRARVALREQGVDSVPFRKAIQALEKAEKRVARQSRDSSLVGACVRSALTQIMADHYEPPEGGDEARWASSLDHSRLVVDAIDTAGKALIGRIRRAAGLQSK